MKLEDKKEYDRLGYLIRKHGESMKKASKLKDKAGLIKNLELMIHYTELQAKIKPSFKANVIIAMLKSELRILQKKGV